MEGEVRVTGARGWIMAADAYPAADGVRPWKWTGSGCGFDRLRGVLILELHGAEIAQS